MLKLKPRLAIADIPPHQLRRKRCTVCGEKYMGHFVSRQCEKPECRAAAIRARGRVSSQKIRDARHEPLPTAKCAWCRNPMARERTTRKTCSDACRAALSRSKRAHCRHDMNAKAAHQGRTGASVRKA